MNQPGTPVHKTTLVLSALIALLASSLMAQLPARRGIELATVGDFSRPNLLAAGDLDGDGSADLLATTDVNTVPGIEARSGNTGNVIWTIPNDRLSADGLQAKAAWLRIDDLDGDGASEFAMVNVNGIEVRSGATG